MGSEDEFPNLDFMRVVSALADVERIVILGILAGGEATTEQLALETGLELSTVGEHLAVLGRARLISTRKVGHRRLLALRQEGLNDLGAWSSDLIAGAAVGDEPVEDVPHGVRQFFTGRRLDSFPARQSRKIEVLSVLVRDFEPGNEYSEAEVNQILLKRYPDFATLRRALIDEGMMTRRAGVYRRVP